MPAPRNSLLYLTVPPSKRPDPYSDLLRDTRGLAHEQRQARETWFEALGLEAKEELLFEFEVLLKASACFANPRNHPGPARRASVVAQDFREPGLLYREGLKRAVTLARQLLGPWDRAFVFHRYLETVLPEDNLRTRLVRNGSDQTTPEQSLLVLRRGLTTAGEVLDGLLRAPQLPYRLFYAHLTMVERIVDQNAYFNPLTALEFRPEFDRIHTPAVLELIRSVPGQQAHRLVALTFLSLFRMLRYLTLLEQLATGNSRKSSIARAYLVLSVLRSDARALSNYLRRRSGLLLARSFESDLMQVPASQVRQKSSDLRAAGHRLIGIKSALEGIAGNLRLEIRRAFLHDLPSPLLSQPPADFRNSLDGSIRNLRPALQNAIVFLGKALGVSLEEGSVFDSDAARREMAERLRRDVWMFSQIVRAFATKAQHAKTADRWAMAHSFEYVREFLTYFRAMGYPLLRSADYPRFDAFMAAIDNLAATDLVDPARMANAVDECTAFHEFLRQLFDNISKRDVLRGSPFDRRAAASALRLYLGD